MDIPSGLEAIKKIRRDTDKILLAFSGGKDSIAAWIKLRPHFDRVLPIYFYMIPDLEFVEYGLQKYEQHFGERIIRMPHPQLYKQLDNGIFQPWDRVEMLEDAGLLDFELEDAREWVAEYLGWEPGEAWTAVGIRALDNLTRRMAAHKYGAINNKRRQFYPVIDMPKREVLSLIKAEGLMLSPEYKYMGRSFESLTFDQVWGIREHYPKDWAKILEWFPMTEMELLRYEWRQKRAGQK